MTPEQKDLVQASFAHVAPIADTAASLFYQKLFQLDPRLRALFADDIAEQQRKLMDMLAVAIANLHRWESVAPQVRQLGARHRGYGVTIADYATVGTALIATLETGLGEAFTDEVRAAWLACYTVVSAEMKQAADPAG